VPKMALLGLVGTSSSASW